MKNTWYKSIRQEDKEDYIAYYIEALATTYKMVVSSYSDLKSFHQNAIIDSGFAKYRYLDALSSAWMFVDSYALFSRLLKDSPFMVKNNSDLKDFFEKSKPVTECRNYHFHLDASNRYQQFKDSHVLGNLAWASNDGQCFFPCETTSIRKNNCFSLVFDTFERKYNSLLSLQFNSYSIDFDYYFGLISIVKNSLIRFFDNDTVKDLFNITEYGILAGSFVVKNETNGELE